jgi:hypothetical protein
MDARAKMVMGSILGAAVGTAVAYVYFTPGGKRLRRDVEPLVDDLVREIGRVHQALTHLREQFDRGMRDAGDPAPTWPRRSA